MIRLHNPTEFDLWCDQIQQSVPAGASVEVTAAQAVAINTTTGVWQLVEDKPEPELEPELEPEPELVRKQTPRRRKNVRGGAVVEVDDGPAMEIR